MFPGFVTTYKDCDKNIHLYFYPGIDENGKIIYKNLDISNTNLEYSEIIYENGSKEFIFHKRNIIKIKCKLVKMNGDIDYENLTI